MFGLSEDTIYKLIELGIGIGFAGICIASINRLFKRISKKKEGLQMNFINSFCNVVIMIACIYYCLSLFNVTKDVSKILLQSGTLLIALATFVAQRALGNVISGISISLTKPFDVNQKIKVYDGASIVTEGIITDITIRHTVLLTPDGQSAIIPNSVMDSSVIVNCNYTPNVSSFLCVEISYDSDVDKAMDIMKKVCVDHKLTLNDNEMVIRVSEFNANGLELKTTIWTKSLIDNYDACSDIRRSLLMEFKANGISIPYTTITIDNR